MAKKNGKKKNTQQNTQQNPPAQQPVKVVKDVELSSEDKERLIAEGEAEKERLIKEGEDTKAGLIADGEKKKDDIESKAIAEVEKTKEKIQKKYIDEVKADATAEAEAIKEKILEDANKLKDEAESARTEASEQLESVKVKTEELAKREEELLKDTAALDSMKIAYKHEVLEQIKKDNPDLYEQLSSLENQNAQLTQNLKKKDREIKECQEDLEDLENQIAECNIRKSRVKQLEGEIEQKKIAFDALNEQYEKSRKIIDDLNAQILRYGDDPRAMVTERDELEQENGVLKDRLSQYPSLDDIKQMRLYKELLDKAQEELSKLKLEKTQLEAEMITLKTYEADLENAKRFIRVLELQREELQRELDDVQSRYEHKKKKVFAMLDSIDNENITANYSRIGISLENICDNFRNYLAGKESNPLYYSERSIRTFFAGLAASRLVILQGMSGTGKSSLPKAFEEYMGAVTSRVPVQSSWRDRNDLLGFYNDFEKRFKETDFLKALYSATRDENNIHLIMLDEMNLSRIEYYFADFLSVLEEENPDNWKIHLISDDVDGDMPKYITNGDLQIRENTWFIGTANKDDSTFTITDKVYDRAIVLNFDKREAEFSPRRETNSIKMSYAEFHELLNNACRISKDDRTELRRIIDYLDQAMQTFFEISFGNRISKQIEMFVPAYQKCGGTMKEAIDIIFESKVLRKLQGLYDDGTKKGLNEFLEMLETDYSKDFTISKKTIRNMVARM